MFCFKVGQTIWWPVLGLMKSKVHGQSLETIARLMGDKTVVMKQTTEQIVTQRRDDIVRRSMSPSW